MIGRRDSAHHSEEFNSSDEIVGEGAAGIGIVDDNDLNLSIAGNDGVRGEKQSEAQRRRQRYVEDGERPDTFRDRPESHRQERPVEVDEADDLIRDAENNIAHIYEVAGKNKLGPIKDGDLDNGPGSAGIKHIDKSFVQAVVIDDGYLTLGMFLDLAIRKQNRGRGLCRFS